jgi:uncharacterized membrane protein
VLDFVIMNTLAEIEAAAESLSPAQKEELRRFLTERLRASVETSSRARLVHCNSDVLLEAPPGAPPMSPENVRRMLEEWP